jgi:hypothetical protein
MGSKLHIEPFQSCFLRPGDKKSQKSQFYERFQCGFIDFGPETANISIFAGLRENNTSNILSNGCRKCWQYSISILAGIKNHTFRDPYSVRIMSMTTDNFTSIQSAAEMNLTGLPPNLANKYF